MTMPHLMNCDHSSDAWCLECVKKEHDEHEGEMDRVLAEARSLRDLLRSAAYYVVRVPQTELLLDRIYDVLEGRS